MVRRAQSEEDVMGKAVSFLWMSMFLAQLLLASGLGSLIVAYGNVTVVMWVAMVAGCLATLTTCSVNFSPRTKTSSS